VEFTQKEHEEVGKFDLYNNKTLWSIRMMAGAPRCPPASSLNTPVKFISLYPLSSSYSPSAFSSSAPLQAVHHLPNILDSSFSTRYILLWFVE
jgi:hypothetical protein